MPALTLPQRIYFDIAGKKNNRCKERKAIKGGLKNFNPGGGDVDIKRMEVPPRMPSFERSTTGSFDVPFRMWVGGTVASWLVVRSTSGGSSPGLSPGRRHCVVFLSKTLYSHTASLHPGVKIGASKLNARGNHAMD